MKSLVYTLLLASTPSLVFASSNQHLRGSDSVYTSEASAAHGYVESIDGAYGFNGISIPGENCDSTGASYVNAQAHGMDVIASSCCILLSSPGSTG